MAKARPTVAKARGEAIPEWEIRAMIFDLTEADRLIKRGMRNQHVKDSVCNHIHRELCELKAMYAAAK